MINEEKVNKAYDQLDAFMATWCDEHKLNYFEIIHILAMLDMKIKQNNLEGFLLETVNRFSQKMNEEDEAGK